MLKTTRILVAVAALATTLVGGGVAWASTTHISGKTPLRQHVTLVTVQANNPNWTDTGVALQAHHALTITAQGIVNNGLYATGPSGRSLAEYSCGSPSGYTVVAASLRCSSLIGKIGNGNPFQANYVNVTNSAAGELFLTMNDAVGTFGDNTGHWTVTITTSP